MRIDPVAAALGLASVEDDSEVFTAAVESCAESYLRAGGVVSWAEWCSMSEATRGAFERAGDTVRREHAALIALACGAPPLPAQVVADRLDENAIADHAELVSALDAATKEIGGKAG